LRGSSVAFRCSYSYREGETVRETAWSKGHIKQHNWKRVELSDLASYENRSVYLGDRQHNCSLAIHDVQGNDSGYYYFRFDTDTYGWRSRAGESVHLSVTELSARVHPERVRAGDDVTLECGTSCYRPPGTVWFKDGRPVANLTFQAQPGDSGNYSCAIEGQESDPSDPVALDVQYAPLNMSIEVSQPGDVAEGSSVNPTCSAVANPAADNYTWYGASVSSSSSSAMLWVGSGQVLTLPPGKASHAGLYLCQARNSVGENSREALLTGYHTDSEYMYHRLSQNVQCLPGVFQEQCHDYENTMNMKNINNHLFPGHLNNLASCDHNTCVSKGESNEYSSMIAVQ
uniref:Ig-like domain-containing protein n=1 Tax=Scophthalmus maximus TaxID=52904 RepID=A0A8D3A263_SCOMX